VPAMKQWYGRGRELWLGLLEVPAGVPCKSRYKGRQGKNITKGRGGVPRPFLLAS